MLRRSAFTLVELLVVIGIIALLISILLPSLNRARGQANLIDCQARLRQIGQAMQIYATDNKGLIPWSMLYHDAPHLTSVPNPYPNEKWWKWHYTLSQVLGVDNMKGDPNALWTQNSAVFIDKDTIEGVPWGWRSDYIANPRVFTPNDTNDSFPPVKTTGQVSQRKVAGFRNAAEVMAVWDAPQWDGYGNSSSEYAQSMQGWQWYWGTYYVYPPDPSWQSWLTDQYNLPIWPGAEQGSGNSGKLLQKKWNKDFGGAPWAPTTAGEDWASAFRFRHVQNSTLNALFVDGHVDSRKVGSVLLRDVCTNYK